LNLLKKYFSGLNPIKLVNHVKKLNFLSNILEKIKKINERWEGGVG
jgi:DnaJ-domain-containing protein 1